ncbi:MAG: L-seryl-tRNA(Sec) selenium transferase, partial [Actinobacteria bacterium]
MLGGHNADAETIAAELAAAIELRSPTKMINGTGVLLHTNLGRALLSDAAANAARVAATNYTNLELDRVDGSRGKRGWHTSRLLTETTGAEDAILVNNNAAGVLLTLAALAPGKAVPVSRGELIEIGGSYRLPDVMKASG